MIPYNAAENEPKLVVNTALETNNLFIENIGTIQAIYNINGYLSEDGYVDTFKDESKYVEADFDSVIDSIGTIDLGYMLTFSLSVIEEDNITIHTYKSDKMRNLKKLDDYHFEIPAVNKGVISKEAAGALIMDHVYDDSFDYELYRKSNYAGNMITHLLNEKMNIYMNGILSHKKYDNFIDELNVFSERYNILFEQSEGSEMMASSIYVVKKYFELEWETIFKLLKGEILVLDNIINELNDTVGKLKHKELSDYWKDNFKIASLNPSVFKSKDNKSMIDSKDLKTQLQDWYKDSEDVTDLKGIYLIYRNGKLFYIGEGFIYNRLIRHFNKPYRPVIDDRIRPFLKILEDDLYVVVLKMNNSDDIKIRMLFEKIFTYNMIPEFIDSEINKVLSTSTLTEQNNI